MHEYVLRNDPIWNEGASFLSSSLRGLPRRALIVEDDLALQTVIMRIINEIDPTLEVEWATSTEEASDKILSMSWEEICGLQLVISDMYLPNLQMGTSIWRSCQRHCPGAPFIFMSSMEIDYYLKLFPNKTKTPPLLRKPFSVREFKDVVSDLLR